ncbi:hypothetical protein Kisp02_51400 [Kineosporia sp. NBRC 101731]|nr:hypothetical protein Kisp02_51400 [Kineosporia sp. NBRC 101731]
MATRPGLGREHNPLRRRSDRIQGYCALGAVFLVLAVLPVAVIIGLQTWHHYSAISEQELASSHLVTATVVAADPETRLARSYLAEVSWTYPDRVAHSGHLAITQTTQVGDRVPLWVNDSGAMTAAPTTRLSVWLDTLGLGLGLTFAAVLVGLAGYRASRFALDRRRTHDLEVEWQRFNESRSQGYLN